MNPNREQPRHLMTPRSSSYDSLSSHKQTMSPYHYRKQNSGQKQNIHPHNIDRRKIIQHHYYPGFQNNRASYNNSRQPSGLTLERGRSSLQPQHNSKQNILRKLSMVDNFSEAPDQNMSISQCGYYSMRQSMANAANYAKNNLYAKKNDHSEIGHDRNQFQGRNSILSNHSHNTSKPTSPISFTAANMNMTIDQKLDAIMNRLQKVQKQIAKNTVNPQTKKNGEKSLKCSTVTTSNNASYENQLQQIKQIYTIFRDNKKNQAKINDENYEEIQSLRKMVDSLSKKLEQCFKYMQSAAQNNNNQHIYPKSHEEQYRLNKLQKAIQQLSIKQKQELKVISEKIQSTQEKQSILNRLKTEVDSKANKEKSKQLPIQQCTEIYSQQSFIGLDGRKVQITQTVYYVDQHGYLLDQCRQYLLNQKNQIIRLSQEKLKKFKGNSKVII